MPRPAVVVQRWAGAACRVGSCRGGLKRCKYIAARASRFLRSTAEQFTSPPRHTAQARVGTRHESSTKRVYRCERHRSATEHSNSLRRHVGCGTSPPRNESTAPRALRYT